MKYSDFLKKYLNINIDMISRFRGLWIDGELITISTKTGGGGRDFFDDTFLTSHPLYHSDEDDEWDYNYAYYYFKIPLDKMEEILTIVNQLERD